LAKVNEKDYQCLSARIAALEASMLNSDRAERLISARTEADAGRILEECGYAGAAGLSSRALETMLSDKRAEAFADVEALCPEPALLQVFRLRYDCHNLKVLIKSEAGGTDPTRRGILSLSGILSPEELREGYLSRELSPLPDALQKAAWEAKDTLARTGDGQLADLVLDEGCFAAMNALAETSGLTFLQGYVRLQIDCVNLRTIVRCRRMRRDEAFLKRALLPGGTLPADAIVSGLAAGQSLSDLFASTVCGDAAGLGDACLSGGSMTAFERCCDNTAAAYMDPVVFDGYGPRVVIAYLAALERELAALRLILTGRASNLPPEQIRERMRDLIV